MNVNLGVMPVSHFSGANSSAGTNTPLFGMARTKLAKPVYGPQIRGVLERIREEQFIPDFMKKPVLNWFNVDGPRLARRMELYAMKSGDIRSTGIVFSWREKLILDGHGLLSESGELTPETVKAILSVAVKNSLERLKSQDGGEALYEKLVKVIQETTGVSFSKDEVRQLSSVGLTFPVKGVVNFEHAQRKPRNWFFHNVLIALEEEFNS